MIKYFQAHPCKCSDRTLQGCVFLLIYEQIVFLYPDDWRGVAGAVLLHRPVYGSFSHPLSVARAYGHTMSGMRFSARSARHSAWRMERGTTLQRFLYDCCAHRLADNRCHCVGTKPSSALRFLQPLFFRSIYCRLLCLGRFEIYF